MIIRRDAFVATIVFVVTVTLVALAQTSAKPILYSGVFRWSDLKVEQTKAGERIAIRMRK